MGYAPFKLLRKHRADGTGLEAGRGVVRGNSCPCGIEPKVVRAGVAVSRGRPVAPLAVGNGFDRAVVALGGTRKEHAVGRKGCTFFAFKQETIDAILRYPCVCSFLNLRVLQILHMSPCASCCPRGWWRCHYRL